MAVNEVALAGRVGVVKSGGRFGADRGLYIAAAIGFPLLVLIGYFRTYYFSAFFPDVKPLASSVVHAHGIVMTTWVIYFAAQIALIRTKNYKLHMSMGLVGVALAALVVVVGMTAAVQAHLVRKSAPPGLDPYSFFMIPTSDMLVFVILFVGAFIYRRKPTEHKSLMLLTAINFLPAAFGRMPVVPPEKMLWWAIGIPCLLALTCLGWHTWKHGKLNRVFAIATVLLVVSYPLRIVLAGTSVWLNFVTWLAG
jgi:hypothetical protein